MSIKDFVQGPITNACGGGYGGPPPTHLPPTCGGATVCGGIHTCGPEQGAQLTVGPTICAGIT
ncbi:MAG TPA: hypothetical protein VEZ90_18965, partial [Blastocatellia bacterium]|nr:hypothetical protein [Blastocatellia bacterium]